MALDKKIASLPTFAGSARHVGLPAAVGGVYGAISGAGEAESVEDILPKMGKGALLGAFMTPAFQGAAQLLGGLGRSTIEAGK